MKKIFSLSKKGTGKDNEDVVGAYHNISWVIDGATPLFQNNYFSCENDVVWVVEQLNKWLPYFIQDEYSLEEILIHTIHQVKKEAFRINNTINDVNEYELPTFTIVMVRVIDQQLEYYLLGDCGILLKTNGTIQYITDNRIAEFSERNKKSIQKLQTVKNSQEKDQLMLNALQETRKMLNKEEGYWIGSIDGKGIEHGLSGKRLLEKNARILCFSDGYSRLFELYQLIDIKDFSFDVEYVIETIQQVRRTETEDCEGILYPRAKQSDDLSVILIENS